MSWTSKEGSWYLRGSQTTISTRSVPILIPWESRGKRWLRNTSVPDIVPGHLLTLLVPFSQAPCDLGGSRMPVCRQGSWGSGKLLCGCYRAQPKLKLSLPHPNADLSCAISCRNSLGGKGRDLTFDIGAQHTSRNLFPWVLKPHVFQSERWWPGHLAVQEPHELNFWFHPRPSTNLTHNHQIGQPAPDPHACASYLKLNVGSVCSSVPRAAKWKPATVSASGLYPSSITY